MKAKMSQHGSKCCKHTNDNPDKCIEDEIDKLIKKEEPKYEELPAPTLLYVNTVLGSVGIILNLITLFILIKQKGMINPLIYDDDDDVVRDISRHLLFT